MHTHPIASITALNESLTVAMHFEDPSPHDPSNHLLAVAIIDLAPVPECPGSVYLGVVNTQNGGIEAASPIECGGLGEVTAIYRELPNGRVVDLSQFQVAP